MPKIVAGVPPFIGTRDNLTIYLMNGEYIIRIKSSLTGKRVKRDPAFAKTMMYAGWLKQASKIASVVYQQMPADERMYKQYRQLTGKAMSLLKEGFPTSDITIMLEAVYLPQLVDGGTCDGIEYTHSRDYVNYNSECGVYSCKRTEYKQKRVSVNDDRDMNKNKNKNKNKNEKESYSKSNRSTKGNMLNVANKIDEIDKVANKDKATKVCNVSWGNNVNKVNKVRYKYTQPCYYWGDRPQRAVRVGITGLSCLKYAQYDLSGVQ